MTRSWRRAALLAALAYLVAGLAFGWLAGAAGSARMVRAWRLAAWVVSGLVFAVHVLHEHFRRRSTPRATALHAAAGVALGAFGLAAAANVHGLLVGSSHQRNLAISLLAWPALTALPAFAAALIAAAALTRLHLPAAPRAEVR